MKYSEFHRLASDEGWVVIRQSGSHVIYRKNGEICSVPYHGGSEMRKGICLKLGRKMKLKGF